MSENYDKLSYQGNRPGWNVSDIEIKLKNEDTILTFFERIDLSANEIVAAKTEQEFDFGDSYFLSFRDIEYIRLKTNDMNDFIYLYESDDLIKDIPLTYMRKLTSIIDSEYFDKYFIGKPANKSLVSSIQEYIKEEFQADNFDKYPIVTIESFGDVVVVGLKKL